MALSKIQTSEMLDTPNLGRRNLVINGAMQVAQRNLNGSDTGVTASQYGPVDRFKCRTHSTAGTLTLAHSSDAPAGFDRSYRCTVTTPGTIQTTESLRLDTLIEAQELVRLGHGTSDATGFTISFWVKSSTTGTYSLNVYQYDGSEQVNQLYTIDASDTWEYKTLSFSGNTGTAINYDNGAGFEVAWFLSSGPQIGTNSPSSNWAAYTTANYGAGHTANISAVTNGYLAITGVQLEVGSIATPFEHRRVAEELLLCQRYYYRHGDFDDRKVIAQSYRTSATDVEGVVTFPTTMRTGPSLVATSGTNYYRDYWAANGTNLTTVTAGELGINTAILRWTGHSRTAGHSGYMRTNNASATLDFDAEM